MSYNSVKLNTVSVDINFADLLGNEFITITLHIYNTKNASVLHQIVNFVMFNEMLLECCKNLKSVKLVTKNVDVTALEDLSRLSLSLENRGIEMNIVEQQLHDREIRYYIFSFAFYRTTIFEKKTCIYSFLDANKIERWIVTLGRGLDFYHPPNNRFEIGAYNFRFRPCKATNITFHRCF